MTATPICPRARETDWPTPTNSMETRRNRGFIGCAGPLFLLYQEPSTRAIRYGRRFIARSRQCLVSAIKQSKDVRLFPLGNYFPAAPDSLSVSTSSSSFRKLSLSIEGLASAT